MSARIRHGREDAKKEKVRGSEERGKRGGKVERKEIGRWKLVCYIKSFF